MFGWGLGHAIQGRYNNPKAWIFTAGTAMLVIGAWGPALTADSDTKINTDGSVTATVTVKERNPVFSVLSLVGLGIHIWEIIDVWRLPSNYKVVKQSLFKIRPLVFLDQNKEAKYGLSLDYHF